MIKLTASVIAALALLILASGCQQSPPNGPNVVYCDRFRGEVPPPDGGTDQLTILCPAGWFCRNYPPGFHGLNYRCCRDSAGADCPTLQ